MARFGCYLGCKVYFIKEGYQGMIDGGERIVEADWASVSGEKIALQITIMTFACFRNNSQRRNSYRIRQVSGL